MNFHFRKAEVKDSDAIWKILEQAISRRKNDGSNQWQDGYPNLEIVKKDIEKNAGFVLTNNEMIVGYVTILINDEPEYLKIEGKWLSNSDFVVLHRLAISEDYLGQNLSKKIIDFVKDLALIQKIYSIKADTNHDNFAMMKIFEKCGFQFCGIVHFRGSPRRAYEKQLI